MFSRVKEFFRERAYRASLQLKYRLGFAGIPAVATHLGCFLVGTLLFEPDTAGRVPSQMLVPWELSRVVGEVLVAREYQLVSKSANCLLSPASFRLFQPEEKKVFIIVPKVKQWIDLSGEWQKADTQLLRKDLVKESPCQKSRSHAEVFG